MTASRWWAGALAVVCLSAGLAVAGYLALDVACVQSEPMKGLGGLLLGYLMVPAARKLYAVRPWVAQST